MINLNLKEGQITTQIVSFTQIRGTISECNILVCQVGSEPRGGNNLKTEFGVNVYYISISSVQFSRSVVSDSLRPHESQHAWPPCPSPTPGVHSDSRHRVSDAIQPSHPLSSPSPPAPNLSQHQTLFQWVNSLHEVAKVLEFQLQHHSFQRNPRAHLLLNGLVGSPCSPSIA